ncbi:MAG: NADP-dependent phosphogluconate dehydrogenase [Flavobacteriaceae bacterium]|nr:NADP-dependent phosphogluconate dehydrogenase [Flavobacteriaceae bacterium]
MKGELFIIMGVSGSGKTTVGRLLASEMNMPFFDADDFHPKSNLDKMKSGLALDDNDRRPWLELLSEELHNWSNSEGAVLACSALKESYRGILQSKDVKINWIVLRGSYDLVRQRMTERKDHFFSAELLQSQFDAMEWPDYGIHVPIEHQPAEMVSRIKTIFRFRHECRLGLIGLGVMGSQLSRNMLNKDFKLSVYNRYTEQEKDVIDEFIKSCNNDQSLNGFTDLGEFVQSISKPRTIILMVSAGKAVDLVLNELSGLLDAGDLIVDGGNSFFKDTIRRQKNLEESQIGFVGMGISGGSEGALKGPSMMPGGNKGHIIEILPVLEMIAARDSQGNPCCSYIGPDGSGHFVKMVHNGIEYAEMQLIAEMYSCLASKYSNEEISSLFSKWSGSGNSSFLLDISSDILRKTNRHGQYWIDLISDVAGSKGTGNWTVQLAAELGCTVSMIGSAVEFRMLSAMKETRIMLSTQVEKPGDDFEIEDSVLLTAYRTARIINHHQGFEMLRIASETYNWNLNLSELARIWTNGCIIRSELMRNCIDGLKKGAILNDIDILQTVNDSEPALRTAVIEAIQKRISIPGLSSAYNYWIALTTESLPTNLVQAQRDYFGGHGLYLSDDRDDNLVHINWKQ